MVDAVFGYLIDRFSGSDASRIDQHIEPAEISDNGIDGRAYLRRVGNIAGVGAQVLPRRRLQASGTAPDHGNREPRLVQRDGDRPADPGSAAGDNSNFRHDFSVDLHRIDRK